MTLQQENFCYEYCANGYNAKQAYLAAYGQDKKISSPESCACRLLQIPEIKAKVAEIRKVRLDALQIDADRVVEKLAEIAFAKKGDEYYNAASQIKALDILSKQFGLQTQKMEVKQEVIEIGIKG